MKKSPNVIAFCGIDGCGKSSQLHIVKNSLEVNYKVLEDKLEYSPLNDMGKNQVLDMALKARSGIEILTHYLHLQSSEYDEYDYILCDRHLLCYLAYAIAYDVKQIDLVRKILSIINDPDLTLYFDVSVAESLARINKRGQKVNKSENEKILSKAKLGYIYLISRMENIDVIDSNGTMEETTDQVQKKIYKKFRVKI